MSTSAKGAGASLHRILKEQSTGMHVAKSLYKTILAVGVIGTGVATHLGGAMLGGAVLLGSVVVALMVLAGAIATEQLVAVVGLAAAVALIRVVDVTGAWSLPDASAMAILLLQVFAAAFPFVFRRYFASRGATSLLGQVVVLLAVATAPYAPWSAGWFGIAVAGVMLVTMLRGGGLVMLRMWRARLRSQVQISRPAPTAAPDRSWQMDPTKVRDGLRLETQVGALLEQLPEDRWQVLHSRSLPGTNADIDHLAIGVPGVVQIDSKNHRGRITEELIPAQTTVDDDGELVETPLHAEYWLNGSADNMAELLQPVTFEARRLVQTLRIMPDDLTVIVCFGEDMAMDEDVVELFFDGVPVTLCTIGNLMDVIGSLPDKTWRKPGRALRRRHDEATAAAMANQQYVRDLAFAADYAMPPKIR